MKKLPLSVTLLLFSSITSFASESPVKEITLKNQIEHPTYLRADIIVGKFHSLKMQSNKYTQRNHTFSSIGADLGLGYYLSCKLRAELIYNHVTDPLFKYTTPTGDINLKSKVRIRTLMARAMFDVFSVGPTTLFIGGGIGGSRVMQKRSGTLNGKEVSEKSPGKNNFAYSIHAGLSYNIAEGLIAEASWGLRDYGKARNLVTRSNGLTIPSTKLKLRSQSVSLGLRFEV
jgi:opacity protein-like surface antigen